MADRELKGRWLIFASGLGIILALAAFIYFGDRVSEAPGPESRPRAERFALVGYSDLNGQPGFKMAMQRAGERWLLYVGSLWKPGWSVVDVTDPAKPRVIRFIDGPANTLTGQVQVSHGLMIAGLQHPIPELIKTAPWHTFSYLLLQTLKGKPPLQPWIKPDEGVWIFDVSHPDQPRKIGSWRSGGTGTHRNFYNGGRYAYLAANRPGVRGEELVVLDLADPSAPKLAAEWRLPEQDIAHGPKPTRDGYYLHGPAHIEGHRAYLPYGIGGAIILDVTNPRSPRLIGRYQPPDDWGSAQGVHTFLPLPGRNLAVINSEAHAESCRPDPGHTYAAILDLSNEAAPKLVSAFPPAQPPVGASYATFCDRAGRAGPHNQAHSNGEPHLFQSSDLTFVASFSSGLQLYSTADPAHVREIGYFIPPDPKVRHGALPSRLVTQTEDVLVDARGYAYITDKNQGLYIVRSTAPEFLREIAPGHAP